MSLDIKEAIVPTISDSLLLCLLVYLIVVYVRRYHEDRLLLKSWIWTNFALQVASTGILFCTMYNNSDLQFIGIIVTSIIALLSQSFLAFQAYLAASQRWHFLFGVWAFAVITFVSGLVSASQLRKGRGSTNEFIITTIFMSLSAGLDVLLAAVFSYGFLKGQDSFDPIAYRVMRILIITMNTLALITVVDLIAFTVTRSHLGISLLTNSILSKSYFLAVLLPINNRIMMTTNDEENKYTIDSEKFSKHNPFGNNSIDLDKSRISESGYIYEHSTPIIPTPESAHLPCSKTSTMSTSTSNRFSQINLEATHAGYWESLDNDY